MQFPIIIVHASAVEIIISKLMRSVKKYYSKVNPGNLELFIFEL